MKWASSISSSNHLAQAIEECSTDILAQLGGEQPDLALVFASENHASAYDQLAEMLSQSLRPKQLLGCSAGGVIGDGRELEHEHGISICAAVLPGVTVHPFRVRPENANTLSVDELKQVIGCFEKPPKAFLLLADPFSFDTDEFLPLLDQAFPESVKIGGLASGARQPGRNALFYNARLEDSGLVGLALNGNLNVDTIVAQGCRPVGNPMFVTKCERNILKELDCQAPKEVLQNLYESLSPRDQELFEYSLFLGLVMRPGDKQFKQGDFLIRNLVGMDPDTGFLGVGAPLEETQVVQFHLRDALTSHEDLNSQLESYKAERMASGNCGALLFSCMGRGKYLYGASRHDSKAFKELLGELPLGGFFCNGEIGPVSGTTYLHGFTSCFAIFRPGNS